MGIEYRVLADKKPCIADLKLIQDALKKCSLFRNVILVEQGIYVPDDEHGSSFDLLDIYLIDEGLLVAINFHRKEIKNLLEIIQNAMRDKGINTTVEEV